MISLISMMLMWILDGKQYVGCYQSANLFCTFCISYGGGNSTLKLLFIRGF